MATLLAEHVIQLEFSDLTSRRPLRVGSQPRPRAAGAHVSDVLGYLARYTGKLKPYEPLEEDMPGRVMLGMAWEEFYFSLAASGNDTDWQPGEATVDGISGNCDGLGEFLIPHQVPLVRACIDEVKCTEKKVRTGAKFLEAEGTDWYWLHQGREYCYLYSLALHDLDEDANRFLPITVVRYTICFYRGDYRGSGPILKQYLIDFTWEEIRGTHAMILSNVDKAMEAKNAEKEQQAHRLPLLGNR